MRHVQIKIMFILPIIDGKKAHRNNCMNDVRLLDMSEKWIKNPYQEQARIVLPMTRASSRQKNAIFFSFFPVRRIISIECEFSPESFLHKIFLRFVILCKRSLAIRLSRSDQMLNRLLIFDSFFYSSFFTRNVLFFFRPDT